MGRGTGRFNAPSVATAGVTVRTVVIGGSCASTATGRRPDEDAAPGPERRDGRVAALAVRPGRWLGRNRGLRRDRPERVGDRGPRCPPAPRRAQPRSRRCAGARGARGPGVLPRHRRAHRPALPPVRRRPGRRPPPRRRHAPPGGRRARHAAGRRADAAVPVLGDRGGRAQAAPGGPRGVAGPGGGAAPADDGPALHRPPGGRRAAPPAPRPRTGLCRGVPRGQPGRGGPGLRRGGRRAVLDRAVPRLRPPPHPRDAGGRGAGGDRHRRGRRRAGGPLRGGRQRAGAPGRHRHRLPPGLPRPGRRPRTPRQACQVRPHPGARARRRERRTAVGRGPPHPAPDPCAAPGPGPGEPGARGHRGVLAGVLVARDRPPQGPPQHPGRPPQADRRAARPRPPPIGRPVGARPGPAYPRHPRPGLHPGPRRTDPHRHRWGGSPGTRERGGAGPR